MSRRWPNKYIVGLTGNIATGKSVVLKLAGEQGALVVDADKLVHELLAGDAEMQDAVETAFGDTVRNPDGSINREKLGSFVFNDDIKLANLESIVHPAVRQKLLSIIDESHERIVFIEAIKLLESGLAEECDQIWVTRCPSKVQIERLITYRGMDEETAAQRVSAQSSQAAKIAAADMVIDTAETLEDTASYFLLAWDRMMRIVPGPIAIWQQRQKAAADKQRADALSASSGSSPGMGSGNAGLDNPFTNLGVSTGPRPRASAGAQRVIFLTDGVTVQRATPSDVPDVLWLIRRTAGSAIRTKRRDLLMTLGERGYLIGRKDGEISSLAGWSSENLVATVDLIIITPPEAAYHTGAAIMQEIEDTANSLICEVILAFPPTDPSEEMRLLFEARGYVLIDADVLPKAWRSAVEENQPHDTLIYMKILRDIRQVGPA